MYTWTKFASKTFHLLGKYLYVCGEEVVSLEVVVEGKYEVTLQNGVKHVFHDERSLSTIMSAIVGKPKEK